MKFISKNSNLNIILRPGQQAQPITGTPAVSALSVRFQNGMADISDEKLVEMMKMHSGFNQDFIAVDEAGSDPYAHLREGSEPQHVTTEMVYGHPVNRSNPPVMKSIPPEIKKMITEQATAIANEMVKQQLPSMVSEALKVLAEQSAASKKDLPVSEELTSDSPIVEKAKPGRPKSK